MIRAYLDSSTFVKQFAKEEGSEVAHKLFNACENGEIELTTSQWTIGESIAAIDKKFSRDEMTEEDRDFSVKLLLETTNSLADKKYLIIIPLNENVVSASWKYITSDHLSADDALQLLSFMMIKSEGFFTSDRYLLESIKQEGIDGYNIEDENDAMKVIKMLEG
ncbi:MAG: putative nucleic acid-binding protein [Candidatus Nitrosomirales archaeon]